MTRIRLLAIGLFLLLSGNAWADLRTYDVPPQYQQEILEALSVVLNTPVNVPGMPSGRVQRLPSGQIVVNASPETLDQVDQVLQAIRARPVPAAPRVELRYWAVLGSRAAVTNPPGTATPNALGPVLAELERLHGDLMFRVIGMAAVATDSGQNGEVKGTTLDVSQRVFVQGESLNASIRMNLRNVGLGTQTNEVNVRGEIAVQTTLRRGEFVVLGQSEVVGGGLDGPLFFIVNWPEK
jgi:hypothetical protein